MTAPELLIPAGDFEKMRYAFAFGADAVYLGVPQFSLRARENGFRTIEQVAEAVQYGQALGKKVYVTANIFPHNHKIESFRSFAGRLLGACRPDAWIMSDPGLMMIMREDHPQEVIHVSVQANTVNYQSARFWQTMGVRRVILSRELNIREVAAIVGACPDLEFEAFVHGAICIAYSGRCLISNYLSQRDPNQGTCSQACRWSYNVLEKKPASGEFYLEEHERPGEWMPVEEDEHGTYLMNSRDLCAIEYLADLQQAGIVSFKVEGRSKSVYYTAVITRAYRQAIDHMTAGKPFDPALLGEVYTTANRGFIPGFLKGNPGAAAQKYDDSRSDHTTHRFSGIVRGYEADSKLIKVEVRNPIHRQAHLEIVTPQQTLPLDVTALFDSNRKPVDTAHGGAGFCYIPCDHPPGEFALLREELRDTVVSR